MTSLALRPRNVSAGALLIGGGLLAVFPTHALTIVNLTVVTAALSFAVHALAANVPPSGWISPFRWRSPFASGAHRGATGHRADEIGHIRNLIGGRRQEVPGAPPMPPGVLRILRALIASALDISLRDREAVRACRRTVSPLTFAVLTCVPHRRTTIWNTRRGDAHEVTAVVHRILDDLDRIAPGGEARRTSPERPRTEAR